MDNQLGQCGSASPLTAACRPGCSVSEVTASRSGRWPPYPRSTSCADDCSTVPAWIEASVARLFVAVWPPASLISQLRSLDRPARPGLRWTTEDQWHVTLRFLGGVDEIAQGQLRRSLGDVAAGLDPVEVT